MLTQWLYPNNVTTPMLFGEMLIAAVVVVLIAIRLTKLADRFADEWNLGRAFVGMLLLATVTSLPEVVAGATAAAIGSVDMAFAAVYGSCSFNIVIIVIMNLALAGGGSVLREARPTQLLNSSFGIVMIVFSISAIAAVQKFAGSPIIQQTIEVVSSLSIIVTYIWFMTLSQRFEKRDAVTTLLKDAPGRSAGVVIALVVVPHVPAAVGMSAGEIVVPVRLKIRLDSSVASGNAVLKLSAGSKPREAVSVRLLICRALVSNV